MLSRKLLHCYISERRRDGRNAEFRVPIGQTNSQGRGEKFALPVASTLVVWHQQSAVAMEARVTEASELSVLLVDPFTSGHYLSESFQRLGVHTTALYTVDLNEVTTYHAPRADYFDKQIRLESRHPDGIAAFAAAHRFDYVLNGSDGSVEVTDRIAQAVTPRDHNDPATVLLRTDKRRMQEATARRGLPHIPQREITHGAIPANDPALSGLNWPCFIKPSRGGGSVGIARLDDYDALATYLNDVDPEALLGDLRSSLPDDYVLKFLLSEYVDGRECFIDTFSYRGSHYISSIQAYSKVSCNGSPVYRSCEIVTDRNISAMLADYVRAVLDSVGLTNGFAHTEVFVKDDGEPVLIEVNPRISGGSGWVNRLAETEGLLPQPALFKAVVSGAHVGLNYVPPKQISSRILFLSHFSLDPVPDMTAALRPFETVQSVHQFKPTGYVHPAPPKSVFDVACLVLCFGDPTQLSTESNQILSRDLEGW